MNVVIVSSLVTFVPRNYFNFFKEVQAHPSVVGVIFINNKNFKLFLVALTCLLTFAAPRFGWQLLTNLLFSQTNKKNFKDKFKDKFCLMFDDINSPEVIALLKEKKIDLVINARTRSYFKKELLTIPKLGCINIHHGLLPSQRGVMCDLWALYNNEETGFSFHQMSSKIDDGKIIETFKHHLKTNQYLELIDQSASEEGRALSHLLTNLESNAVTSRDNINLKQNDYRKNPTLFDFYKFQLKGIKI